MRALMDLLFKGAFIMKYNESSLPIYRKELMLPENLITGLKSKKGDIKIW